MTEEMENFKLSPSDNPTIEPSVKISTPGTGNSEIAPVGASSALPISGNRSYVVATGPMGSTVVCRADVDDVGPHMGNSVGASNQGVDQSGNSSGNQYEQRLKVEDALNYLDQIKYKFLTKPEVYNNFLDIMKEFKSQSIDTPGVIARVANLFSDHPELIVGFNTFLPPGYKIEIQNNEQVSLSMNLQEGGYVVTPVQPGTGVVPGPTQTIGQPTNKIVQHCVPGLLPIRPSVTHAVHPAHPPLFSNPPLPPPTHLVSNTNSFETGRTPAFTHSSSSPFVQSSLASLKTQSVEFNHAVNCVKKIKNRFQGQPEKYKEFLDILHTYQKERRNVEEGLPPTSNHLSELEVYSQVAKLLENQEDLLQAFSQFLPNAINYQNTGIKVAVDQDKKSAKLTGEFPAPSTFTAPPKVAAPPPPKPTAPPPPKATAPPPPKTAAPPVSAPKRPALDPAPATTKKIISSSAFKDVTLAEAGKWGTLNDFAFFDKVRQSLKSQDIYDNFLRCLSLYTAEIVSRTELLQLVGPFLSKKPELYAWFKGFIGHHDTEAVPQYEPIPQRALRPKRRTEEEQSMEIDFSMCKRLGASYCALPKNSLPVKCSGRTSLCKEVLNDVWVSFPTWSEDSTFMNSRKTQFEECIYRCEDERFELDIVIETNAATIRVLEAVAKKMSRMSPEELKDFHLDECLGGTSPTIHERAVYRLYGDKSIEIMEGLKKLPVVAVPLVLGRLKAKEEEWREAQKGFNKIWAEQVERFYLKSLDHQGITFKQSDRRALRSKSLTNEIETIFDERNEQKSSGPHLSFVYQNREIFDDACNLLLDHVGRQSIIEEDDKRKMEQLLKYFIPDLFHHPRNDLTDIENDENSEKAAAPRKSPVKSLPNVGTNKNGSKRNGGSRRLYVSKQGNGGRKKDFTDYCHADSNSSNSADAICSYGYGSKPAGEAQVSRRTLAKRDLKQSSESGRYRAQLLQSDGALEGDMSKNRPHEMKGHRAAKIIPILTHDLDEQYTLIYVNSCWYVFLRLHQILCERLTRMKETAVSIMNEEAKEVQDVNNSPAVHLLLKAKREIKVQEYYATFLKMVTSLLDGNMDGNNYEDTLREMFGIHAYIAFTMDKLVTNAVRQLQTLVTHDMCQVCHALFVEAGKRGGTGGYCATAQQRISAEIAYQNQAEKVLVENNCIKVVIYKNQRQMTMELLEVEHSSPTCDHRVDQRAKLSTYFQRFVNPGESVSYDLRRELLEKPIFLPRNIRKCKKTSGMENKEDGEISGRRNIGPTESIQRPLVIRDKPGSSRLAQEPEDTEINKEMGRILLSKSRLRGAKSDLLLDDSLQCHFNPNSFKMRYAVNSGNFIYVKGALIRAHETHKKVSRRLDTAFFRWHQRWLDENVTEEQGRSCMDFFVSRSKHLTRVIRTNDIRKAPYRPINRYKVDARKL